MMGLGGLGMDPSGPSQRCRAQLDRFDGEYLTPFMTACSGGHVEVAAYLQLGMAYHGMLD